MSLDNLPILESLRELTKRPIKTVEKAIISGFNVDGIYVKEVFAMGIVNSETFGMKPGKKFLVYIEKNSKSLVATQTDYIINYDAG